MKYIGYEEMVCQIKNRTVTQIPALLFVLVKECIRRNVFVNDEVLLKVVKNCIEQEREKSNGKIHTTKKTTDKN